MNLYQNYQEIIDFNYQHLEELDLNYDGLVIDLEWINFGLEKNEISNQYKYLEILAYLKNKFKSKKLYAFLSIVDDSQENIRRGYQEEDLLNYLDNLIVLLYLKDSGFYLSENELKLTLRSIRVDNLRDYYQKNNYQTAVSLTSGIFLERNKNLYFIKTTNSFNYQKNLKKFYTKDYKYYRVSGYELEKNIKIKRDDGKLAELKTGEKLHFLKIKAEKIIAENDYIWEYFQLQK